MSLDYEKSFYSLDYVKSVEKGGHLLFTPHSYAAVKRLCDEIEHTEDEAALLPLMQKVDDLLDKAVELADEKIARETEIWRQWVREGIV